MIPAKEKRMHMVIHKKKERKKQHCQLPKRHILANNDHQCFPSRCVCSAASSKSVCWWGLPTGHMCSNLLPCLTFIWGARPGPCPSFSPVSFATAIQTDGGMLPTLAARPLLLSCPDSDPCLKQGSVEEFRSEFSLNSFRGRYARMWPGGWY